MCSSPYYKVPGVGMYFYNQTRVGHHLKDFNACLPASKQIKDSACSPIQHDSTFGLQPSLAAQ